MATETSGESMLMLDWHHTRVGSSFVHEVRLVVLRFLIQARIPPTLKHNTARVATLSASCQLIGTRILYVVITAIRKFVSTDTCDA